MYTETPHDPGTVKKHIVVPGKTCYTQKERERWCAVVPCCMTLADTLCPKQVTVN